MLWISFYKRSMVLSWLPLIPELKPIIQSVMFSPSVNVRLLYSFYKVHLLLLKHSYLIQLEVIIQSEKLFSLSGTANGGLSAAHSDLDAFYRGLSWFLRWFVQREAYVLMGDLCRYMHACTSFSNFCVKLLTWVKLLILRFRSFLNCMFC